LGFVTDNEARSYFASTVLTILLNLHISFHAVLALSSRMREREREKRKGVATYTSFSEEGDLI
jgi:hypothetical protein